ncbi:MAG: hypothetical protein II943_08215 [Victivallales bacterium]|nr:hypothetical protein [Victivallales bacterium]
MNEEYLKNAIAMAKENAAEFGEEFDIRLFISGVAKRASQLAQGYPRLIPMLPGDNQTSFLDIALQEVAIGQVIIRHGGQVETKGKDSTEISMVD